MATAATDPIVIASDDDSDNDDVVLIKEEIEVDSEDVIFLSETKATPRCETTRNSTSTSIDSCSDGQDMLSRSVSLTACTDQLTLDDAGDPRLDSSDTADSLADGSPARSGVCPLDLSSKSLDKSVHSDPKKSSDTQTGSSETSFFMLLMGDESDNSLSLATGHAGSDSSTSMQSAVSQVALSGTVLPSSGLTSSSTSSACDSTLRSLSAPDWTSNNPFFSKPSTSANQTSDDTSNNQVDASSGVTACKLSLKKSISVDTSLVQSTQSSISDCVNNSFLSNRDGIKNSAITCDADTTMSVTPKPSTDLLDPFQASHALLSSLDLSLNSDSQGSVVSPATQTSLSSSLSQSGLYTGNTSTAGQSSMYKAGLPGGSNTDAGCYNSLFSSSVRKSSASSISDTNTYYNSLTLPLSMQDKSFKTKSKQKLDITGLKDVSCGISNSLKSPCDRSPSPQNLHHLPLKKQRRRYSDNQQDANCTNCSMNLIGEKSSQCPNGHITCTRCLEERVKLVLTGRAKESVKCLNPSCDSFYPISELRQSLPSMVVEILEEKLDQDYVNFISDMILKQASEELDNASGESEQSDYGNEMRYYRKYEDCPGNWDAMDERDVNKNGYVLVQLEQESAEYETVLLRFFDSMVDHNVEVTAIHRVQNPIQWKYYTVKKSEMVRDNEGFNSVVEGQLFHGTSSSAVENICRKGFDWRLCGKHGTLYGQGSYFAVNASYSHQYTDLRRPYSTFRSPFTMSHPGMHLQPPPTPYTLYPPTPLTFPVSLNGNLIPNPAASATPSSPVTSTSQFRPMNLSSNSTASVNQPMGIPVSNSQTGSINQLGSSQNVQIINNISNQSASSSLSGSTSCVSTSLAQPGPSGTSHHWQPNYSNLQKSDYMVLAQKKKSHHCPKKFCSGKILPKPVAIRSISGLASTALVTNLDTPPEPERPKACVFLARVLVGKYTVGNPKLRKPPPLYPNSDQFGKCYDSCVDNEVDPKIFVVFDSTQAYPEYLLEYSYGQDKPSWL